MNIIKASVEIMGAPDGKEILRHIETCGRVCYQSEGKKTEDSADAFVRMLIRRGHESVLEHASLSVRFIVDRGVSHEIVRHRLASYSQESTRYCRYGDKITVISPCYIKEDSREWWMWWRSCIKAQITYNTMLEKGMTPQEARAVLPHSLKTELIMTANLREWRLFLRLRTAKAAHPQMREVAIPLLHKMQALLPAVFDDIKEE